MGIRKNGKQKRNAYKQFFSVSDGKNKQTFEMPIAWGAYHWSITTVVVLALVWFGMDWLPSSDLGTTSTVRVVQKSPTKKVSSRDREQKRREKRFTDRFDMDRFDTPLTYSSNEDTTSWLSGLWPSFFGPRKLKKFGT